MKKLSVSLTLLIVSYCLHGQGVIQDPVSSRIFNPQKYSNIKGSPFLYENWVKGTVTTSRGFFYKDLDLKVDIYSNAVLYNKAGSSEEIIDVKKFALHPKPTDSSSYQYYIKNIEGAGLQPDQYVRVLVDGKVSLYRSDIVIVTEMSEINAGMVKTFSVNTRYFLKRDGKLQLMKTNKKDVLNLVSDKEKEIAKFIEANELSLRKEEHMIEVFKYYNTL